MIYPISIMTGYPEPWRVGGLTGSPWLAGCMIGVAINTNGLSSRVILLWVPVVKGYGKHESLVVGRLFSPGILSAFRSALVDWRFIETLAPVKGRFAVAVWCLEFLPSLTVFMADSWLFGFPRFSHAALGRGFDRVLHTQILTFQ